MTTSEFKNVKIGENVIYDKEIWAVVSINPSEYLFEISDGTDDTMWVRCENTMMDIEYSPV